MIGSARFQHIGLTAKTALTALLRLTKLRDYRAALVALDEEITSLREGLQVANGDQNGAQSKEGRKAEVMTYEDVDDLGRLQRLVSAKEKTRSALEKRVSWAGMDASRQDNG